MARDKTKQAEYKKRYDAAHKAELAKYRKRYYAGHKAEFAKYRATHYVNRAEYDKRYRAKNLPAVSYSQAERRAKVKGLEFDLPGPLPIPAVCPFTGFTFSVNPSTRQHVGPRRPSLDRIDPKAGYTVGNTRVIGNWANTAKGQLSDAEFTGFCAAVTARALAKSSLSSAIDFVRAIVHSPALDLAPLRLRHALLTRSPYHEAEIAASA